MELPISFIHKPPSEYYYETTTFKRNVHAIWLCRNSNYSLIGRSSRTIWGFYNSTKGKYYSPVTSTKQGDPVEIDRTTPYSAMVRHLNPLETLLYG